MTEQESEAIRATLLSSLNSSFHGAADESSPVALEGITSLPDLVTDWIIDSISVLVVDARPAESEP